MAVILLQVDRRAIENPQLWKFGLCSMYVLMCRQL